MTMFWRGLTALAPVLLPLGLAAQAPSPEPPAADRFAKPVPLLAGGPPAGIRRSYPSPAFHDVNGDGHPDLLVGDLVGKVTVAIAEPRLAPDAEGESAAADALTEPGLRFGKERPLLGKDRKPLRFHNW